MPESFPYMEVLSWALPPIIGALIGYITNDIAIKMLFRPLRAYHIGPFRVPLTPGIIPRQREKLAESIGLMVSRELITEDAIRKQVSSPAFKETLAARIRDLTEIVLKTPIEGLAERFKKEAGAVKMMNRDPSGASTELPADTMLIRDILSAFFRSDAFFNGLDQALSIATDSFFRMKLKTLIGKDGARLFEFISEHVQLDGMRGPVKKIAGELTIEGIRNRVGLDRLLTLRSIDGIVAAINRLYPGIARELLNFLKTPHIHVTLEQRGRTVLRRLISRMSSLQRLFIVAGQYDRNLEEQMEAIVDDLLVQLELAIADEATREKILGTLKSWLQRLSTHSVADLADVWGESLPEDVEKGIDAVFQLLKSEQVKGWTHTLVSRALEKYGDERIGNLLAEVAGNNEQELCAAISRWIVEQIKKAETASQTTIEFFRRLFAALSDKGHRSVAEIVRLEDQHKDRLDGALHRFILRVIDLQVPTILESVDVRTLVVDKINSLDIEKVEELILIVIRTHLRWIIFFGAILGFSIGSIQVVLTKLM